MFIFQLFSLTIDSSFENNNNNTTIMEDTYDVPSKLSASVEELSSLPSSTNPMMVGRSAHRPHRPFDYGRAGKRNSEPVIPTCE